MNRLAIVVTILLLITCIGESFAKGQSSSKLKPTWIGKTPKSTNSEMQFIVVEDITTSLTGVSETRYTNLENYLDKEVQTSGTINTIATKNSNNAYIDFLTTIKGGKYRPTQIDQYWKKLSDGMYHHYYLYSVATLNYDGNDVILLNEKYGCSGLWRSMIVPGWGQFHKGSKVKGGLMLSGIAVAAVGAVFTDNMVGDYQNKIKQTHDVTHIKTYQSKVDNFMAARNICIGAAAALYIYNLVDAIAAPGARRVIVTKNKSRNYTFSPSVTNDGAMGMAASIKF